jgi:hypothetical protein
LYNYINRNAPSRDTETAAGDENALLDHAVGGDDAICQLTRIKRCTEIQQKSY